MPKEKLKQKNLRIKKQLKKTIEESGFKQQGNKNILQTLHFFKELANMNLRISLNNSSISVHRQIKGTQRWINYFGGGSLYFRNNDGELENILTEILNF
jgi:hypothetical protein